MKLKQILLKFFAVSMILLISMAGVLKPKRADAFFEIFTTDLPELGATLLDTAENIGLWAKDWAIDEAKYLYEEGIALAYKKALSYYLSQLAHDAAVYLVTGDKGQSTMFYTESWGEYLGNVADNAAGHFLEELGANSPVAFDLCDPGLDVTMKIGYGLLQSEDPDEPDCTYIEMKNNW